MPQSVVHRTLELTTFDHSAEHASVLAKMLAGARELTPQDAMMALSMILVFAQDLTAVWKAVAGDMFPLVTTLTTRTLGTTYRQAYEPLRPVSPARSRFKTKR